jgi:hypothetical protein
MGEGLAKGDSTNVVIDLRFLQLVRRNLCRVPAIGVLPHGVNQSSEWLDPTLYESPNELDSRKFFLGRGSKLLDFLHQGLDDFHFFIRKLVPPRHPGSKDGGGSKLLKPEVFASGGLILGIKPFRPPAGVAFGRL